MLISAKVSFEDGRRSYKELLRPLDTSVYVEFDLGYLNRTSWKEYSGRTGSGSPVMAHDRAAFGDLSTIFKRSVLVRLTEIRHHSRLLMLHNHALIGPLRSKYRLIAHHTKILLLSRSILIVASKVQRLRLAILQTQCHSNRQLRAIHNVRRLSLRHRVRLFQQTDRQESVHRSMMQQATNTSVTTVPQASVCNLDTRTTDPLKARDRVCHHYPNL